MNWNVRFAYIQTVAMSIGFGIIQTAFAVYVIDGLGNPKIVLGNLFTVSGLASTIFVFPSGWAADKYRRDTLIRISVFFGLLSQVILFIAISLPPSDLVLTILFIEQFLGGLGWGLSGPAAQALLADSIEAGNRSKVFAKMHFANLIAAALGPILAASLSFFLGDKWEVSVLRPIIMVGILATSIAYFAMIFVSDSKALVSIKDKEAQIVPSESATEDKNDERESVSILGRTFYLPSYNWVVPAIIVISGIIIGFGAGATVAFFSILFALEYSIPPVFTYLVFGITNIFTGFAGLMAQRMISFFGRIASMFIVQILAIICLLGLMFNLVLFQNNLISFPVSVTLLVVFYISRNALMNASSPISRSIVMDVVPPHDRAKWNSLETLAWGMFWSVSASIGGFIIDTFGFVYVFLFTATLYTIATLILLTITNRVPKESVLAHTYQLGKLKTRNRVVLPSITVTDESKFGDISGQLTPSAISYYAEIAEGGVGLVYLEPAYISDSGKGHSYQLGIHQDYVIPRMMETIKRIHKTGALAGISLRHAGGATTNFLSGDQPIAPSAITINDGDPARALTQDELTDIQMYYIKAAVRAVTAGFDVIEISACTFPQKFSNLLGQFISTDFNLRVDEYGGVLENRIRFPLDVIRAIKAHIPQEIMLAFHISLPLQGLSNVDLLETVKSLEKTGINLLSIGYSGSWSQRDGFDDLCEIIRKNVSTLPLVVHGDFNVDSAETALRKGQADLIGFEKLIQEDRSFPQALN
ncbi:MAG: MFS transporter [Candidatus Hodarchaeota archaeon]